MRAVCIGGIANGLQIAYEALTLLMFALILIYASPTVSLLFILVAALAFLIIRNVSERFTQTLGRSGCGSTACVSA